MTKPKNDTAIIYLKSDSYSEVSRNRHIDRAVIGNWTRDNSHIRDYDLIITSIMDGNKTYHEAMDNILEMVKGHKNFILIINVGCHATKYVYDKLLAQVESPACVTLLGVLEYINLQQAMLVEKLPITISLNAVRRCFTANQLNDIMTDAARIKTQPNGIIEYSYASKINVEVERRPESLDEKFNTIMQGGLSNLTPYWDITPIYIDPIPVTPNPEIDQALDGDKESISE